MSTEAPSASAGLSGADEPALRELFGALRNIRETDVRCADLLQFRSLVTAMQYAPLYATVDRYVAPGGAVLDRGCGNGHFYYGMLHLGYQVFGYSFEDFGLRRHLGEDYRFRRGTEAEPESLPYVEASFDAVVSVGVLEHVRETGGSEAASMREIYRVLKPGGRFICFHFPNRFSWIDAVAAKLPGVYHHEYRCARRDIAALCTAAGFRLLEVQRYSALPRNFWHRAPQRIGNSSYVAAAWNRLDGALAKLLSPICQNYLFVAERPKDATAEAGAGIPTHSSLRSAVHR